MKIGEPQRITGVSDMLRDDLFYIASGSRPEQAVELYHTIQKFAADDNQALFVVSGGFHDIPLGFIHGHLCRGNTVGFIDWLFVDARYQKMGIGGKLLMTMTDYFKDRGVSQIELYSAPMATEFYRARNFIKVGYMGKMQKKL